MEDSMSDIPLWMVRGQKVIVKDAVFKDDEWNEFYEGVILGVVRKLNGELCILVEDRNSVFIQRTEQLTPKE